MGERLNAEKERNRDSMMAFPALRLCIYASLRCLILLLLASCGSIVPATTPPQLAFTPGPPVVVTDRVYETADFTARYPSGWRIVTSAADEPTSVVFVGLDEQATITLMVGALSDAQFDRSKQTDIRGITLKDEKLVTAIGRAPTALWETFLPIFDAVVESVE